MAVTNPFHIDLIPNDTQVTGNLDGEAINVKSGALGLFITAILDGATLKIQQKPKGSTFWYGKPAGEFTQLGLAQFQVWDNTNLAEGDVRLVVENGTANTVINEALLRPTHETEVDL